MALKLRTGAENLTKPDKVGGFTPFISWKDGDRKFLAFITPAAEIPKVKIHNFVKVPTGNDEKPFRWGTFMCRKDPAWIDESGGECLLCEKGLKSREIYAALAVELEPEFEGKKVVGLAPKFYEGSDGKQYPQVGLILQGKKNFFGWLGAYNEQREDITKVSFDILRQGATKDDTKYLFFDISQRPDLTHLEEFFPDLPELMEDMGSQETYDGLVDVKASDQSVFSLEAKKESSDNGNLPEANVDAQEEFAKLREDLGLKTAE
jgi:hypothetical protein